MFTIELYIIFLNWRYRFESTAPLSTWKFNRLKYISPLPLQVTSFLLPPPLPPKKNQNVLHETIVYEVLISHN